ncbi:isoamyl acetate-hydrolyzing esterase 1 homolog isoform X2 [Salvia splendens]|uniref:isoamyl acetate-hydrolyzing esterase 1 homolog isoform X2 n=1 Tax=Salvia splendens TaxID=180675 RepID=UPI001C258CB7|nr:isoamyl acetate-hydrolyzing esterase 1 homolog isoform X2 [Salvia splendens]
MRPQIVLFGDSITQQSFRSGGWGASVADTYSRKVDVVLRGYGGYNTRYLKRLLLQRLLFFSGLMMLLFWRALEKGSMYLWKKQGKLEKNGSANQDLFDVINIQATNL